MSPLHPLLPYISLPTPLLLACMHGWYMFSRRIASSCTFTTALFALKTIPSYSTSFPAKPSSSSSFRYSAFARTSFARSMASTDQAFPPQKQETQPGKEHIMEPAPHSTPSDYRASNRLQGKVALVTGGDSGIGRAVCYCFAKEGATVAFTYVKSHEDKDANDSLRMLMENRAADAKDPVSIPTDLGYDENCKRVVDEVVNMFGRIDVLVNNAAEQYEAMSVEEISEERLDRVFKTNMFACFYMVK